MFANNCSSPFISITCSSDNASLVIGSTPFSARYFSISLLSNTQLDEGDTQGCSGTSLLTTEQRDWLLDSSLFDPFPMKVLF